MDENVKNIISKNKKIIIYPIIVLLLILVSIFTLIKSFTPAKEKEINYKESSNIDYKVYLKKNSFYENEFLDGNSGNMLYVASLIDRINIAFNYMFSTEENSTVEFEYKIMGDLIVSDDTGTKNYYKKTYTLLDTKTAKMTDAANFSVKEEIDIDYNYYNDIVNNFRSSYGLSVDSKLDVYMLVTKKNSENIELMDDKLNSSINFIVPLSEKAVNIKMDYKDLEETSYLIKLSDTVLGNKVLFASSIVLLVFALLVYVSWLKLFNSVVKKKTKYEKNIDRILKEYDRLVVETSTPPLLDNYNIVEVNDFPELIDVHDNLNVPIMYYNLEEEKMSYFYIIYQDTLYRHIIRETEEIINDNMEEDEIGVNSDLTDVVDNENIEQQDDDILEEEQVIEEINNNIEKFEETENYDDYTGFDVNNSSDVLEENNNQEYFQETKEENNKLDNVTEVLEENNDQEYFQETKVENNELDNITEVLEENNDQNYFDENENYESLDNVINDNYNNQLDDDFIVSNDNNDVSDETEFEIDIEDNDINYPENQNNVSRKKRRRKRRKRNKNSNFKVE